MRLVTRADFDGLVCGVLLVEKGLVDDIVFVHPKDLQDGYFSAQQNDVLCNVPYVEGCGMWFDHHVSELERVGRFSSEKGESRIADSCARIIYDYYGGAKTFPWAAEMLGAVDRLDSGKVTLDDIFNPQRWILIGFLTDPRTGLGRFHHFQVSSYQLMLRFINGFYKHSVDEILAHPHIIELIEFYKSQTEAFQQMVRDRVCVMDNVIVADLRQQETIYVSNRFMIYAMFPDQNVSVWVTQTKGNVNDLIACGYSVLDRSCTVDVGKLMAKYGGGGHRQVGTCQVPQADTDRIMKEVLTVLRVK